MITETGQIAYTPLPEFTREQRGKLSSALESTYSMLDIGYLEPRVLGEEQSTYILNLSEAKAQRLPDFLNTEVNPDLGRFVLGIQAETQLPSNTVEGMLAQLWVEIGIPKTIFGDKAHVFAFRGNEYGVNSATLDMLGIDAHTLVVTKLVGGPKFRENLRLFYEFCNSAAPHAEDLNTNILNVPLIYQPHKSVGQAYREWVINTQKIGGYDEARTKEMLDLAETRIREFALQKHRNHGWAIAEWDLAGRQLIQDEAYYNFLTYMDLLLNDLHNSGTEVYLLVSNFESDANGKNITLSEWAGRDSANRAEVKLDPIAEARRHGIHILDKNMLFSTPDGIVLLASYPFLNLLRERPGVQLEDVFIHYNETRNLIQSAKRRGQHTILMMSAHPYLPESEAWRGVSQVTEAPTSVSNIRGGLTARQLTNLGTHATVFAHTPNLRRGYAGEGQVPPEINPNELWIADNETTRLNHVGELNIPKGRETYIHHVPERVTAMTVLFDGESMDRTGSKTLPLRVLPHVG